MTFSSDLAVLNVRVLPLAAQIVVFVHATCKQGLRVETAPVGVDTGVYQHFLR